LPYKAKRGKARGKARQGKARGYPTFSKSEIRKNEKMKILDFHTGVLWHYFVHSVRILFIIN